MKEKIAILKSEINSDYEKLDRLFSRVRKSYNEFLDSNDYAKLVETAFYVSQLYSGLENIFKNIAKTFENNIEQDYWHKSLLERMSLEIENIRPALITSDRCLQLLNELRAFRHYFRNAYDIEIDHEKFGIVANKIWPLQALFEKDVKDFIHFLDSLLE